MWRQMLADLYRCPVQTLRQTEGPALGAAILAGVVCGIYESVEKACEKMISPEKTCMPKEENAAVYEQYHKLYKKLYQSLKEDYKELARL